MAAFAFLAAFKIGFGLASGGGNAESQRVEEVLAPVILGNLNQTRQEIFNALHPVGIARSVELDRVTVIRWKGGRDTNRPEDLGAVRYEFTLRWDSPLVLQGFTRIACDYDFDLQRETNVQLLATNGLTNQNAQDTAYLLGAVAGILMQE